jgi:hypothetical protein
MLLLCCIRREKDVGQGLFAFRYLPQQGLDPIQRRRDGDPCGV